MDKRINNGGARKGAGRKSKADEQRLIENLTPMNEKALKSLEPVSYTHLTLPTILRV